MRRILVSIIMIASAFAAALAVSADETLKKASEALTSGNGVTATFSLASDDGGVAKGAFTMAGKKFAIITPEYASWYNGADLWSFSDQTGETTLSTPSREELLEINPFEIISRYSQAYNAKNAKAPQGKAAVELRPKEKSASVKKAVITVSQSTWLPTSIVIDFASGASVSVNVLSISKPASPIGAAVFEYPLMMYQGVEVIDLR